MYKGFNLTLTRADKMDFMDISSQDIKLYSSGLHELRSNLLDKVSSNIDLTDETGIIDVTKLKNNWFPENNYDVFISHSHNDVLIAKRIACWLKNEFDIDAFIDSTVWGYSNDLLKKIDDRYCVLSENKKTGRITYDYDKRNYSTSQVNLILSSALHDMIDSCECIIFLNTENSISVVNTIRNKTNSPWLYDELQTTRLINKKVPERLLLETEIRQSDYINKSSNELPPFQHDVTQELTKLLKITKDDLVTWEHKWSSIQNKGNCKPLDLLYSHRL